jgi:hypothetical protein
MLKMGSPFQVLHDSRLAWTSPRLLEGERYSIKATSDRCELLIRHELEME